MWQPSHSSLVIRSVVLIRELRTLLMPSNQFIFTNHALERLHQRSISQSMAESVLHQPDRTEPGKKPGTMKFIRTLNGRNIQIVATFLQDQRKWLVVSAWVRGEDDKVPLMWQLITLPFKMVWWIVKALISAVTKR
jgi:hypothetical protein